MTVQLFFQLLGMYTLGQLIHLCFWDFPRNRKSARIANMRFRALDGLKDDWFLWVGNLLLGVALLFVLGELHFITDKITGKERLFFLVFGGFGSFAIQTKWGRLQEKINNIIDEKTNIADGLPPPENHNNA